MKQLKSTKKPNPHARHIIISVRLNAEEMRELIGKAHETEDNVGEYIRLAIKIWKPEKKDFVS